MVPVNSGLGAMDQVMFSKLEISHGRAIFWPLAHVAYWGLIFLSWWDTRVKVYFGVSVFQKFLELRSFSSVTQYLGELEAEAYSAVTQNGSMAGDFIIIPLIMAVVIFIVPFIVRRDSKGPVKGPVILPAMTFLCYFFASFLNLILVVALSVGIHYMLYSVPGPDICMFMVHPLYLLFPIFRSIPGFASQCIYLLFTASVLSTESALEYEGDEEGEYEYKFDEEQPGGSDDGDSWDKSACLMEMDRFSRIINSKFNNPSFLERIREDFGSFLNIPGRIKEEIDDGSPHYSIVLTQMSNSLRSILMENPRAAQARDVFAFVVEEMARMEFITEPEAITMKTSMGINPTVRKTGRRVEFQQPEPAAVYPARPSEAQTNNRAAFQTPAAATAAKQAERFVSYQPQWTDTQVQPAPSEAKPEEEKQEPQAVAQQLETKPPELPESPNDGLSGEEVKTHDAPVEIQPEPEPENLAAEIEERYDSEWPPPSEIS